LRNQLDGLSKMRWMSAVFAAVLIFWFGFLTSSADEPSQSIQNDPVSSTER